MKTIKSDWLIMVIIVAPVLPLIYFWSSFPESFPIHFNVHGEPDRYGSRVTGLLLLPAINVLIYFLLLGLPKLDPSGKNYSLFEYSYKVIRTAIHAFISFTLLVIMGYGLGYNPNTSWLISYGVMLLILVFGNYMSTIRPNYFVGVKTPWTLASPEVWKKTHRLTAKVWVLGALVMMIVYPFYNGVMIAGVVIIASIPIVYSYVEFKRELKQNETL